MSLHSWISVGVLGGCLLASLLSAAVNAQQPPSWIDVSPSTTMSPPARNGHAMAYHEGLGEAVLFGGVSGPSFLQDTWCWNGTTRTWTNYSMPPLQPAARSGHAMAYDRTRSVIVLFGGIRGPVGPFLLDAQAVAFDAEADALRRGILPPLEFVVVELEDRVAADADHVVVMRVAEHVFELAPAIAGVEPFDEARALEHRDRPVDRRARDARIDPAAALEQLFGGEVVVRREGLAHDQRALAGPPEAGAAQVVLDDVLFLLGLHRGAG